MSYYETLVSDSKELLKRLDNFKIFTVRVSNFLTFRINCIKEIVTISASERHKLNVPFYKIEEYLDRFDDDWYNDYSLDEYIKNLYVNNQLADVAACADFWHTEAEKIEEARKWATYQDARFSKTEQQPEQSGDYPEPIEIR